MENEEVIRQKMEKNRESLTEKLETLEEKISETVEGATTAVKETVEDARSAVKETVETVKETVEESVESVKDAMDISAHVQNHPFLMLGGAIAGGYILGSLLSDRTSRVDPTAEAMASSSTSNWSTNDRPTKNEEPENNWLAGFEDEIKQWKGVAIGVALGAFRELIKDQVPERLSDTVSSLIDAFTVKMGGEPMAASEKKGALGSAQADNGKSPFDNKRRGNGAVEMPQTAEFPY